MTTITIVHLEAATILGERRAKREINEFYEEAGYPQEPALYSPEPTDNVWDDIDPQDMIFEVTGEKISPNSEEGWLLLDAYENAYYNEYDNNEQEIAA